MDKFNLNPLSELNLESLALDQRCEMLHSEMLRMLSLLKHPLIKESLVELQESNPFSPRHLITLLEELEASTGRLLSSLSAHGKDPSQKRSFIDGSSTSTEDPSLTEPQEDHGTTTPLTPLALPIGISLTQKRFMEVLQLMGLLFLEKNSEYNNKTDIDTYYPFKRDSVLHSWNEKFVRYFNLADTQTEHAKLHRLDTCIDMAVISIMAYILEERWS